LVPKLERVEDAEVKAAVVHGAAGFPAFPGESRRRASNIVEEPPLLGPQS
jgi:hypothetical protein